MGKNTTIYDIAQEAGVSATTVSRVMSGSSLVNKKTARRVLSVMERMDYHPSTIARSLYKKSSRTLCILLPELGNPYYSTLFSAVIGQAEQEGYTLQTMYQPYNRAITEAMAQGLIERRVDGVIMNGESLSVNAEAQLPLLRRMSEYMRIVLIGGMSPINPFPTITIDLAACTEHAVSYLHDELSHSSIWLLGGTPAPHNPYSRTNGYAAAMRRLGLQSNFIPCECTCEAAYAWAMTEPTLPGAIICANDMVALGVMRAATERGISIPNELSIVGFDHTYLSDYLPIRLTTFDLQAKQTGQLAMSMAAGLEPARNVFVPGELLLGESCGVGR